LFESLNNRAFHGFSFLKIAGFSEQRVQDLFLKGSAGEGKYQRVFSSKTPGNDPFDGDEEEEEPSSGFRFCAFWFWGFSALG
jgi:hypothetical protein